MTLDEALDALRAAGCNEAADLVAGETGLSRRIAVHSAHATIESFRARSPAELLARQEGLTAIIQVAQVLGVQLAAPEPQPHRPRRPRS